MGSHIRVRLLTNLDSRTDTPVEALIVSPFMLNDEVKIPPKTVFYGTASARGPRFTIAFDRMRLPDQREVEFRGLALDVGDGKAGLRASRSISSDGVEGPGLGARVARSTAATAVAGAPLAPGLGSALVKGAAGDTVAGVGQDTGGGRSGESAIMLDAPVLFEVFVSAAF
jgi:hypothetical protein